MHYLIDTRLSDDAPARTAEQLDLFADLESRPG
jgi:hypothetical protein